MLSGGVGVTQTDRTCAFLIKILPTLLHSFTSHSSPHPCHASSHHLKHTPTMIPHCHVSFIRCLSSTPSLVFHFGGFCHLFSSSVFVLYVAFSCIKKAILSCFSASVSLSVYLCPCGRLPGCLAAGGKWGHPVGDLIRRTLRGEALPLAACGPNRRGLVLLPFSSQSLCVSVSLMSLPSVYSPAKMWSVRLEKSSSVPALCVLFPV